jgi:hypothetical protein
MPPKNASGVLLRRGLAHHVFGSRLYFFGYRQVPQLRIDEHPRAISKSYTLYSYIVPPNIKSVKSTGAIPAEQDDGEEPRGMD